MPVHTPTSQALFDRRTQLWQRLTAPPVHNEELEQERTNYNQLIYQMQQLKATQAVLVAKQGASILRLQNLARQCPPIRNKAELKKELEGIRFRLNARFADYGGNFPEDFADEMAVRLAAVAAQLPTALAATSPSPLGLE